MSSSSSSICLMSLVYLLVPSCLFSLPWSSNSMRIGSERARGRAAETKDWASRGVSSGHLHSSSRYSRFNVDNRIQSFRYLDQGALQWAPLECAPANATTCPTSIAAKCFASVVTLTLQRWQAHGTVLQERKANLFGVRSDCQRYVSSGTSEVTTWEEIERASTSSTCASIPIDHVLVGQQACMRVKVEILFVVDMRDDDDESKSTIQDWIRSKEIWGLIIHRQRTNNRVARHQWHDQQPRAFADELVRSDWNRFQVQLVLLHSLFENELNHDDDDDYYSTLSFK